MNVRSVVIVTKHKQPDVAGVAAELAEWFKGRNIEASLDPQAASKADLAVVVGGDGTLPTSARLLCDRQITLLAINFGGLCFLKKVTLNRKYTAPGGEIYS